MKDKREKIDVKVELQALYEVCKRVRLSAEQMVHAACISQKAQVAKLRDPMNGREQRARCLALLCCVEGGCCRKVELAGMLGLKCPELVALARKARTLFEKDSGWSGGCVRRMRRNVESGQAACEIVILGREVFGLPRKRERSRLLSRKLCEDVADKVMRLDDEEMLFRGCLVVGRFGGSKHPSFRRALTKKEMRYLVLLVAQGDGPRDSRIKGIMTVSDEEKGTTLSNFFIEPEFRGHGWGRKMLDELVRTYKSDNKGCLSLRLDVNTANEAALRLYRSVGFTDDMMTMRMELEER